MNIEISNEAKLPTKFGLFKIKAFKEGHKEHLAIYKEPFGEVVLVRVHSECLTGDALGSLKCDCQAQLHYAQKAIAESGGMIIYLRQEGRNIGLLNKVNAYALQDGGLDTIEANHQLGFEADERTYEMAEVILEHFGIKKIELFTNNPEKILAFKSVHVESRRAIIIPSNNFNSEYLFTKKDKMNHLY